MKKFKVDVLLNARGLSTEPAIKEYIIEANHYERNDTTYVFFADKNENGNWPRIACFPVANSIVLEHDNS